MIVMTVDSEVWVERGVFEVEVILAEREGEENILQLPGEVAVAYFLEFSCVRQGWAILEIFLFPVNGCESVVLSFRGSSS